MKNVKYTKTWLMQTYLTIYMVSIICVFPLVVHAESMHSHVHDGVRNYLLSQLNDEHSDTDIDINIVEIDERITIPPCDSGFQFNASSTSLNQSYISVRVSCDNNDWYLFTSAHVSRTKQIVVTSGAISPGTVLTSANLALADVDIRRLRYSAFDNIEDLVGARMKRRIVDGQAVQSNMLCFVCKGDRITISASLSGMAVKTSGIAQQDGVIGDTIKVLNASSRKAIIAEVANAQEVVIHL